MSESKEPIDYESQLQWATVDEVYLDWIDGDPPMDDDVIAFQLWRAEDKILSDVPNIQKNVDDGLIRESTVSRVAVNMAMRRLTNPRFQRSIQRSDGPFNMSVTTGGDHPGEIYLSDADLADLTPKRPTKRRAHSVMPNYRL